VCDERETEKEKERQGERGREKEREMLGMIEPRALCMLGKSSTTELRPQLG
jgi:hypothetical protein